MDIFVAFSFQDLQNTDVSKHINYTSMRWQLRDIFATDDDSRNYGRGLKEAGMVEQINTAMDISLLLEKRKINE